MPVLHFSLRVSLTYAMAVLRMYVLRQQDDQEIEGKKKQVSARYRTFDPISYFPPYLLVHPAQAGKKSKEKKTQAERAKNHIGPVVAHLK